MVPKYLLISVLFFSVSLVAPKKKTCDTDNTKRLYETAVEHYNAANYAAAIKCLDTCIDCFSLNVEARVLRIQVNKKLNYMEPACEDLNVLRSYGAAEADTIAVPNCTDEIRWWKVETNKHLLKEDSLLLEKSYVKTEQSVQETADTAKTETLPIYPGGEEAMFRDFYKLVTYPQECVENNISGTVILEFVVEKDGRMSNLEIVRKIPNGRSLNMTAYKAVLNLKNFTPATINNKPVRCKLRLPVTFKLQ
jgi:TonB family protein